jgi:hypothetical protein
MRPIEGSHVRLLKGKIPESGDLHLTTTVPFETANWQNTNRVVPYDCDMIMMILLSISILFYCYIMNVVIEIVFTQSIF